ncbi:hypothetical protein [Solidesulfovibrio sp. C21]|uniref:hypothetical protein n=1 Tax=Solidesulfovibrio sp. C21 TaxID=3398613 RepID=UPI0039FD0040
MILSAGPPGTKTRFPTAQKTNAKYTTLILKFYGGLPLHSSAHAYIRKIATQTCKLFFGSWASPGEQFQAIRKKMPKTGAKALV